MKYKNKAFFVFKRYQIRNQKDDFKVRRLRIDYDEKYKNYDFNYHRADQNIS